MSRSTILFGVVLAALVPSSLCGPLALLHADEAPAAAAANATPAASPRGHDAEIIRLRDIAYGKDDDGNFKEPSVRVREAAKERKSRL